MENFDYQSILVDSGSNVQWWILFMKRTSLLGKAGLDDSNGGEGGAASTVFLVLDLKIFATIQL